VSSGLEERALADAGRTLEDEQATVPGHRVADGALDRPKLRRALLEHLPDKCSGTGAHHIGAREGFGPHPSQPTTICLTGGIARIGVRQG
jgi:hypothetical protein